jgi:hypothetical protein
VNLLQARHKKGHTVIFKLAERENEGYFIMFEGDHEVGHFR